MVATMLILLAITGCTHLSGERLSDATPNSDSTAKGTKVTAIPFFLVRPHYTLARTVPTDAGASARYTLNVSYEPDPTQWYSIRLNPAWLSNPTFKLYFTTTGSLKTVNASTAEQITPTIKAIGSFVASLASTAATIAAFRTADPRDGIYAQLASLPECKIKWDFQMPASLLPPDVTAPPSVGSVLTQRLKSYSDLDTAHGKIHYATIGELACFKAVKKAAADIPAALIAKSKGDFDTELTKYRTGHPGDSFADTVSAAVIDLDLDKLAPATATVQANYASADATVKKLAGEQDGLLALAKADIKVQADSSTETLLTTIVEMPQVNWRARHIVFLEDEMDRMTVYAAQHPLLDPASRSSLDRYQASLADQKALTVGDEDLYKRSLALQNFLAKVPSKSVDHGSAPAASEYATIRAELDALATGMQTRLDTVVAAASPPKAAPLTALTDAPLKIITANDVASSQNETGFAKNHPD
jgi:hypothetical protein